MLLALRAFLGSALGRIGGWIVAGLSVLAWLKWRDWSAHKRGRAEAETATREATLRKREEMAAVPQPDSEETVRSLHEGRF